MATITAVTDIQDANGNSLVPADPNGTKPLKVLRLGSTLTPTYTRSGDTGIVSFDVATASAVSSYIKPTGSGGTAGMRIGRFDLGGLGPVPGTLTIGNDDGSGDAVTVDGSTSSISLTYDLSTTGTLTVTGTLAAGSTYVGGTLGASGDTAIGGALTVTGAASAPMLALTTAPTDLATLGTINLGTDGTHLQVRPNGAAARTVWDSSQTIPAANGGTGQSSYAAGNILYASASTTLSKLAPGTSTQILHGGTTPSWSAVSLAADVTGTLPAAYGGTGASSYTAGDMLYANGAATLTKVGIGTSSQVLTSSGTAPQWGSVALASMVSGTLPAANGGTGATSIGNGLTVSGAALVAVVDATDNALTVGAGGIALKSTVAGSRTFSGAVTLSSLGTALSVTHDVSVGGGLGVTGTAALGAVTASSLTLSTALAAAYGGTGATGLDSTLAVTGGALGVARPSTFYSYDLTADISGITSTSFTDFTNGSGTTFQFTVTGANGGTMVLARAGAITFSGGNASAQWRWKIVRPDTSTVYTKGISSSSSMAYLDSTYFNQSGTYTITLQVKLTVVSGTPSVNCRPVAQADLEGMTATGIYK